MDSEETASLIPDWDPEDEKHWTTAQLVRMGQAVDDARYGISAVQGNLPSLLAALGATEEQLAEMVRHYCSDEPPSIPGPPVPKS